MPLTAGFPVMQGLYAFLAATDRLLAIAVILSTGLVSLIVIRISFFVFGRDHGGTMGLTGLSSKERIIFLTLIIFLVAAGLFPNLFFNGFGRMVSDFEFLVK